MTSDDFSCEEKLMKECPELHKRYCNSILASVRVLVNYRAVFPDYTDHSYLHTMNIINYCNRLIGENIYSMNCGEIYVLMMAAALHDTGMGISANDYREFLTENDFGVTIAADSAPDPNVIRDLHHELSGCFIRKYSMLFEIPDEFVYPIVQAARGHRRTDLYDANEYPKQYRAQGYTITLPYIAALIRLADELDISAERNISLDRSVSEVKNAYSISVWKLHSLIRDVIFTNSRCIVLVDKNRLDSSDSAELFKWVEKLRTVADYTAEVIAERTSYSMKKRIVAVEYV